MFRLLVPLVAAPLLLGSAAAAQRPVVVELFTSEGCSSCPPADALLTTLAGRPDILALAFHVTYWNALGWRDPFSLESATARQEQYANRLGGGSYTPEIVVDGRRGMVGSEVGVVQGSIAAARAAAVAAVPMTLTRSEHDGVAIDVGPGQGDAPLILVGFDPQRQTHVGRGENGGRFLLESNIVRSFRTIGRYTGSLLHLSERVGAGEKVAVLLQGRDGRILGAARL